jgi:predicted nucleic acid-binding protein
MKIYMDVSCLNRPFDDQDQVRVRLEAAAVGEIFERFDAGDWQHVSSDMATVEVDANPDGERRKRVRLLLPERQNILKMTAAVWNRASAPIQLGFKPADATHVAEAEQAEADVFLTCDDRLLRTAVRSGGGLTVRVANPLDWLKEVDDAANR